MTNDCIGLVKLCYSNCDRICNPSHYSFQQISIRQLYFENPEADDGCDGNFIDEIMSIEPQEIDGKILYYFGGGLCWNIEDDDFIVKRLEAL